MAPGAPVGEIRQQNVFGRSGLVFTITSDRRSERSRPRTGGLDFDIVDASGSQVGRITKTWEGLAKTVFTTADDYLLDIRPGLSGPLRMLTFGSAIGVDTALKQDSRGFG